MNLPNKLSVIRIALVPIFVFFLLTNFTKHTYLIALIIFLISVATDHFDGRIARKYNLITDFGKFIDPLADKILVMSAFMCFVELNVISSVAVIIMIFREFAVTSVRLIAAKKGKVIAANFWGKAKTVGQMVSIIIVLLILYINNLVDIGAFNGKFNVFYQLKSNLYIFANCLIWVCVILTVISGIIYICDNKDVIIKRAE